jgi:hypothetical protein
MQKLRKMLCDIDSPEVKSLMALIETQSKKTLSEWAIAFAKERYLPIYEGYCNNYRLSQILTECEAYLRGEKTLADIRPLLREARDIARNADENEVLQASARAVSTALATITTPTNSLGFLFYGSAAVAYSKAGLNEKSDLYDRIASEEINIALDSLKQTAIPDERNPANINWNC